MLFPYEKILINGAVVKILRREQLLQLINRSIIFGTIFTKFKFRT